MSSRKIVVAYDGSPNSKKALQFGGEIAKELGADLTLVSVIDDDFSVFGGEFDVREFEQMQQAREDFGKKALADGTAQADKLGLKVTTALLIGNPAEELIQYGQRENVYLIVVGSRGFLDSCTGCQIALSFHLLPQ